MRKPVFSRAAALIALPTAVLCVLLTGCQTSGDPREGGLIGGVQGILGGGYQKRLDERQGHIDSLRSDSQAMKSRLEQSQADHARVATQKHALLQQLEQLNTSLTRSRDLLSEADAAKRLDRDTLRSLRDKQQRMESTLRELSAMSYQFGPIDLQPTRPDTAGVKPEEERREHQQQLESKTRKLQQDIADHNTLIDKLFRRDSD